MSLTIADISIT